MKTGLKYPYIAQYNESTGVYTNGFLASKGVEFTTAPAYNSVSVAGDDEIVKQIDKFKNSAISLKVTKFPIAAASVIFGHTVSGTEVKNNTSDVPNYVGLGVVTTTVNDASVDTYTAMIIPKVKFMEGGNSFTTNGDSITITAPQITGMSYADINGDWYIEKTFDTEALALEYVKTTLGILEKCTTPISSVDSGTYAVTQSVVLTAGAGETIYYTDDGLTPTALDTAYTTAISVAVSTMIRAIAIKAGSVNSDVADYEILISA